jgi:hypothetical protein
MGSKLVVLFWIDIYHYLNSKGVRCSYARCSNMKTHNLLINQLGGEAMSKIMMVHEDKEMPLTFVRYAFRSLDELRDLSGRLKNLAKL